MRRQYLSRTLQGNSTIFASILLLIVLLTSCSNSPSGDDSPLSDEAASQGNEYPKTDRAIYDFANSCFIKSAGSIYSASTNNQAIAEAFFMKPSALGIYIFKDSRGRYLDASDGTGVISYSEPRSSSE